MQGKTKQGFVLSVILHVGVVVGAFLFTLLKPLEKPKEQIFELVAPPAPSAEAVVNELVHDFSAPEPPVPVPPRVEPPPPKPVPKPPEPKPTPVQKPKPVPKPPEPKPAPPPKPMTLEEFRKQNPEKTKPKPKTATAPKPVNIPRVDTKFTPNLRETVVNVDYLTGLSQIQQSELESYIARLREALRLCWAKPSGLGHTLVTEVEFSVVPAGSLTRIRITRSSGSVDFDGSVLDAFEALGTGGRTPEGKPLNLRLTFKMNED